MTAGRHSTRLPRPPAHILHRWVQQLPGYVSRRQVGACNVGHECLRTSRCVFAANTPSFLHLEAAKARPRQLISSFADMSLTIDRIHSYSRESISPQPLLTATVNNQNREANEDFLLRPTPLCCHQVLPPAICCGGGSRGARDRGAGGDGGTGGDACNAGRGGSCTGTGQVNVMTSAGEAIARDALRARTAMLGTASTTATMCTKQEQGYHHGGWSPRGKSTGSFAVASRATVLTSTAGAARPQWPDKNNDKHNHGNTTRRRTRSTKDDSADESFEGRAVRRERQGARERNRSPPTNGPRAVLEDNRRRCSPRLARNRAETSRWALSNSCGL